jgi:hypothetical protein
MLEDILILLVLGSGVFLVGIPFYKLVRAIVPHKRNALLEAQERLEQARLDAEAARLNKEAEKLYETLYQESLEEDDSEQKQEKHR